MLQITPTGEQETIQRARDSLCIVEANAGAAKSTTAALRVAHELSTGVHPRSVLLLSYTRPGAQALHDRLLSVGVPSAAIRQMRVQTVDDLARWLLASMDDATTPLLLQPEKLRPHYLRAVARARERVPERHAEAFTVEGTGAAAVEFLMQEFLRIKGTLAIEQAGEDFALSPAAADELGFDYVTLAVLRSYEYLRLRGDSDDRVAFRAEGDATYDLAVRILAGEELPLQSPLRLIVLDEMHDTNRAILTVLGGLLRASPGATFLGLGDVDQVVHKVAGADPSLMRDGFDRELGKAVRRPLSRTFRFGRELSAFMERFAEKRYQSAPNLRTHIECGAVESDRALAERIRSIEVELEQQNKRATLAVLLRHPSRAVGLETELIGLGVDYAHHGFTTYVLRPEILFVRGLLSFGLGAFMETETPATRVAMVNALLLFTERSELPSETDADAQAGGSTTDRPVSAKSLAHNPTAFEGYVGNVVIGQAQPGPRQRMLAAIAALKSHPEGDVAAFLRALDVRWFAERVLVHAEAIEEVAMTVQGLARMASGFDGGVSLLRSLNGLEIRVRAMRKGGRVRLSTIEAAKGLEFDHVIIPSLNAGLFDGESVDERNLFYVAATRAQTRLTLVYEAGRPPSSYIVAYTGSEQGLA